MRAKVAADAVAVSGLLSQLGYEVSAAQVDQHADGARTVVLVAEEDGRVIGMVASHTRWHLHRDGLVTSIDSLVVDREVRSHGVGAALVVAVCDEAKRTGARMVELHSHQSRVEARRFYERHGFEVTSNYFIKQL
ncbi:MAG TPA: GNAT family N-acetyltransferase [Acidimicrobiales bacterium]|nr:GNAT family N-acetyltransferase [Acidimicrobiales bacterium]